MNILYLTHLSGASYAGPTYSVPNQIKAQSKLDNVFWYNACRAQNAEWKKIPYYHDIDEFPGETLKSLPQPFNKPDLIVVECFYSMTRSNLRKELLSMGIPYVIVPRGELTAQGQKRKWPKKLAANLFRMRRYARKAAAIQYLTQQEYEDSGNKWNKNHLIIPNGIHMPEKRCKSGSREGISCVSIGRIEPYQKGLDMLIECCAEIRSELERAGCTITICGPDKEDKRKDLQQSVAEQGLQDIIFFQDGVYGSEKEELLLSSDVFLIPSRFEGHPMALIEALSYGLPCIASKGSNMKNEVDQYNAGWTCENNMESLTKAFLMMLQEKEKFPEKSENAVELSQKYKWDKLAGKSHEDFLKIKDKIYFIN